MNHPLSTDELLQTPTFAAYYQAAVDFCAFIEQKESCMPVDFLLATRPYLVRLYDTASALPWVELQSNKDYEEKLTVDTFHAALSSIAERLGEARYYWHVFDPLDDLDITPVCGDLFDDLGDIYKDIKYALMIFHLGQEECQQNALWQFKCDFNTHWDQHCVNALSAIHFYLKRLQQRS
jgi:hypothetical protein